MQNSKVGALALEGGVFRQHRVSDDARPDGVPAAVRVPLEPVQPAQRPTVLEARGVRIRYENPQTGKLTDAVNGVDLTVRPGEFVSIVGLSGCGKSSFLSAVAGLAPLAAGTIDIGERRVTRPGPDCSVVFQKATLLPWRTVIDNITYGLELRGVRRHAARERAARVVELVQLQGFERFYPGALSGGMQQRVNLARALVTQPRLLLLDEPFAALDAITRETMQQELLSIWSATRNAVLMVTHQIDEAVLLSDRVIVFSARPAHVVQEIEIDLPRPRSEKVRYTRRFDELAEQIWRLIHGSAGRAGRREEVTDER